MFWGCRIAGQRKQVVVVLVLARGEEGGRQHFTPALGQGNAEGRVEFRQDVLEGLAGFH